MTKNHFPLQLQQSICIENGLLESYNADFELQFTHHLKYVVGICKIATTQHSLNGRSKLNEFIAFSSRRGATVNLIDEANTKAGVHGLVYLLKNPRDPLLHVFLFESPHLEQVSRCIFSVLLFSSFYFQFKLNFAS